MKYILFFLVVLFSVSTAQAQSNLSIVDVLPPYDLTATLLSNGHFSVTTKYTDEDKTLIYQEDGAGGRPVNYTSHVHFKVDDVIFQLPYELNPVTRQSPPQNPLDVTTIFRDTLGGTPRINASMIGVMPDGDTMRFRLWMEPVKRPSGGFIRISAEVHNTSGRARQVGVLFLIDTKIGDNDRAPIISAFGYETTETEFEQGTAPGIPPFWLGLEGSPLQPGLTARGNVDADGLITPDFFLFGNWKDNTAVNATGLALAQWNERRAVNTGYTDSSILLLWGEKEMARGERSTRASTEIGLVDSLHVTFGSGGWGGVGFGGGGLGGGGGSGNGCLAFDTLAQRDCADGSFHPYSPDSLQALFLVTNDTAPQLSGASVRVENLPAGLRVRSNASGVNPSTLVAGVTGVATLDFFALPRLFDTVYRIPILVEANGNQTIVRDTLCIFVPGLPSELVLSEEEFFPLCPGLSDTITFTAELEGAQCLDLLPAAEIIGLPADVAQFAVLPPMPGRIPANGSASIRTAYTATAAGTNHQAQLVVYATQRGLNRADRDTTIIISDTVDIRGEGRDAEFFLANTEDTLDFGTICLGDTALREWTITNVGGCDLVIDDTYQFLDDPSAQFSVANAPDFPLTIERKLDGTALIRFAPTVAGSAEARFLVRSSALPFLDTLIVKGFGDAPRYTAVPDTPSDTLCPDELLRLAVHIENPTACPVELDSLYTEDARFVVDAPEGFILPPNSGRRAFVTGRFAVPGEYRTTLHLLSGAAKDTTVEISAVVASRTLTYQPGFDAGDVRVGATGSSAPIAVTAAGTAGVEIRNVRLAGADAAEYSITVLNGIALPHWLDPGEQIEIRIDFSPADIEARRATVIVETDPSTICDAPEPIALTGRGVLPIIDAPERRYDLGRICAGSGIDTTILLRNFGNAPLTVDDVRLLNRSHSMEVDIKGLPLRIEPDSSDVVSLHVKPESLGPFVVDLHFLSNGEPFTPEDTLVRIEGAGVICGQVWVDTVQGVVGDVVNVPIRIDASPLTAGDVVDLINRSNVGGLALQIENDPSIFRFRPEPPVGGMLSGLLTPAAVQATASTVEVRSNSGDGNLVADDALAVLRGDILLGQSDRTLLRLNVSSFADGWADLEVHDGLLLAAYCAIDRRYVQLSKPFIRASQTPLGSDGTLQCWLPEDASITVHLYDLAGRNVGMLFDGRAEAGLHRIVLPGAVIPSGMYIAEMRAGHDRSTAQILVAE